MEAPEGSRDDARRTTIPGTLGWAPDPVESGNTIIAANRSPVHPACSGPLQSACPVRGSRRLTECPVVDDDRYAVDDDRYAMLLAPGTQLGPYQILDAIGAGGMGEVYRATDSRLGREVAVKILPKRHETDSEALELLRREARTVAALSHPNILTIFDVGEAEGRFFVVTELLIGDTLRARLRDGPLSVEDTLTYGLQVVTAMAACHQGGIVHHDLKPDNVVVTRDDQIKILDFGVATFTHALPSSDAETVTLTPATGTDSRVSASGTIRGTVPYMSPEQARGSAADPRSDIFSFGTLLYEMLSGISPFRRGSHVETLHAVLKEPVPPVEHVAEGVPDDLSRLVSRCLAKKPVQRFQTAQEVAVALEIVAANATHRSSVPGGQTKRPDMPSIAVLPFADMSPMGTQAYFCEGMADELITALGRVTGLRAAGRTSAFQFKGDGVDVRRVGDVLGVHTVLEGSVRAAGERLRVSVRLVDTRNGYQLWSERFDRSMSDVFAVQEEIARRVIEALKVTIDRTRTTPERGRPTRDVDAYQTYLEGRHHWNKRTEASLARSVELFHQAAEADPSFGLAFAAMALSHVTLGTYGAVSPGLAMAEARTAATRALEIDAGLADAHIALGSVHAVHDWAWADAAREFGHAIVTQEEDPPRISCMRSTAWFPRASSNRRASGWSMRSHSTRCRPS